MYDIYIYFFFLKLPRIHANFFYVNTICLTPNSRIYFCAGIHVAHYVNKNVLSRPSDLLIYFKGFTNYMIEYRGGSHLFSCFHILENHSLVFKDFFNLCIIFFYYLD